MDRRTDRHLESAWALLDEAREQLETDRRGPAAASACCAMLEAARALLSKINRRAPRYPGAWDLFRSAYEAAEPPSVAVDDGDTEETVAAADALVRPVEKVLRST